MTVPSHVSVVEVGPRDGLQNETLVVPTEIKVEFIQRLAAAGLATIEATSFVTPARVPQLADAAEVLAAVRDLDSVRLLVLVPNVRGLERAVAAGATEIAVFAAASESFSQRNLGRSIVDAIAMFAPVIDGATRRGIQVRGYVSTAFGCPYEGPVATGAVMQVAEQLDELGCDELCLADTVGVATPALVRTVLQTVIDRFGTGRLAVHMHDTYGQGLVNTMAALELGIAVIDAAAGGLGGCPFAEGAKGNLATEDLLYLLDGCGVHTGVDLDAVVATTAWLHDTLGRHPASRAASALLARRR